MSYAHSVYPETRVRPWLAVNRSHPCSICGSDHWCTWATDGTAVRCMRATSGGRESPKGGRTFFLDDDHNPSDIEVRRTPRRAEPQLAPIAQRDRIYREVATVFGLSYADRQHLIGPRGLAPDALDGFATFPPRADALWKDVPTYLVAKYGASALSGVPGFFLDDGTWSLAFGGPGILIPAPNTTGRIQGFQIRLPAGSSPKYIWLSSAVEGKLLPGGTRARPFIAAWTPCPDCHTAWVTEGPLKARIAADLLPGCVYGIAGVNSGEALPALIPLGTRIILAFDRDILTKPEVAHALGVLHGRLADWGHTTAFAQWPMTYKGLDDLLLAGKRPEVR